jgi:Cdc6-like AAA superfamily ATPase
MSDETVFFPPYGRAELATVAGPTLDQAFREGALPAAVREHGLREAARRWGDARKTLRLFRRAGETANEDDSEIIAKSHIDTNLEATDKDDVISNLADLPNNHLSILICVVSWQRRSSEQIVQPITSTKVRKSYEKHIPEDAQIGERAFRECITDLETMGLIETWIDSRGSGGRVKQIETTFDPAWVKETAKQYIG